MNKEQNKKPEKKPPKASSPSGAPASGPVRRGSAAASSSKDTAPSGPVRSDLVAAASSKDSTPSGPVRRGSAAAASSKKRTRRTGGSSSIPEVSPSKMQQDETTGSILLDDLREAAGDKSVTPHLPEGATHDDRGRFVAGHAKLGGQLAGAKQHNSLRVQNAVIEMVANEVEKQRFVEGLTELYDSNRKDYYTVMSNLLKFAAPTLQSQSLEVNANAKVRTDIDDKLDALMNED